MDIVFSFFISDLWIFRVLFLLYLINTLYKIVKLFVMENSKDILKKLEFNRTLKKILFYHSFMIVTSLIMLVNSLLIGAGIVILITNFVISFQKFEMLVNLPLVGGIAKAAKDINDHFVNNRDFVKKHFNSRGFQKFTIFTKNPELKQWRKETKEILSKHTMLIFRDSIVINIIIGLTLYFINGEFVPISGSASFQISKGILVTIFGIFFCLVQAVMLGAFSGLFVSGFMGDIIQLRHSILHNKPNLSQYL